MSNSSPSHHGHSSRLSGTAETTRIIHELHDSESAYIKTLDAVHTHFFQPIIDSLDTPDPILDRDDLLAIFTNFQDIWKQHKSFLAILTANLFLSTPPPLAPLIRSHLSACIPLYLQFVAEFPNAMVAYTKMTETRMELAVFVACQEAGQYGNLTSCMFPIIQRCGGYLANLKDLVGGCSKKERSQLFEIQALASRIDPLITAPEYSTYNLVTLRQHNPIDKFRLDSVATGPPFLKRGTFLVSGEDRDDFTQWRVRDFLLYTDSMYWLSASGDEDTIPGEDWNWGRGAGHLWAIQMRVDLGDLGVILRDSGELDICIPNASYSVYTCGNSDLQEWAEAILHAKFAFAKEVAQADEEAATLHRPKSRLSSHLGSIKLRASSSIRNPSSHRRNVSFWKRCSGLLCTGSDDNYDMSVTDVTL